MSRGARSATATAAIQSAGPESEHQSGSRGATLGGAACKMVDERSQADVRGSTSRSNTKEGGSDDHPRGRPALGMGGGPKEASGQGEGVHSPPRSAQQGASRAALGTCRGG